jgi:tRNA pseudouridine55 synthase
MQVDGILLVDKPREWSSFDVVAKVRGILRQETGKKIKVGHTGTLDPLATGLMIIVVGSYCKRASEFSKLDKTYEVTMKLGQTSTTGDEEGEKTATSDGKPSLDELQAVLGGFMGEIDQVPPIYSAIKINGQRAYKLARAGKEVTIEPRRVSIYELTNVEYNYPTVKFTVGVSSGTYVRSLVQDIGTKLGTGAYMTALRRIEVGQFRVENATLVTELGIDKLSII